MPKKKPIDISPQPEVAQEKQPVLITDLETLKSVLKEKKLNPLEKTMAINLLTENHYFYTQYKIDVPEGWTIQGKKYFVVDFLLPEEKIIIETEGKIHDNERNYQYDRDRMNTLTALGYRIFRFNWDDVMGTNEKFDINDFITILKDYLDNEWGEVYMEGYKDKEKKHEQA